MLITSLLLNLVLVAGCLVLGIRILRSGRCPTETMTPTEQGLSIEVDCRACKRFNRVASQRLRDRPRCGHCKARLMPGKRLVICSLSPVDKTTVAELDKVWRDEERLWPHLADHLARRVSRGAQG